MFKQAIIYYPTDEKILKQINKDIAALHCVAAVKYMEKMKYSDEQKATLIDSLISDLSDKQKASA